MRVNAELTNGGTVGLQQPLPLSPPMLTNPFDEMKNEREPSNCPNRKLNWPSVAETTLSSCIPSGTPMSFSQIGGSAHARSKEAIVASEAATKNPTYRCGNTCVLLLSELPVESVSGTGGKR